MGLLDEMLKKMKLNDDDYDDEYDDDDYDDDDYIEEEAEKETKHKNPFKRNSKKSDYYDEEEHDTKNKSKRFGSKVTPMQSSRRPEMHVCVIQPTTVNEAREVTETLLSGSTVILNLEGLDIDIAQRIIDFTAGAAFAIDGNLQKISNYIFLVTPANVDISGDLQDLLNSSFDVPPLSKRY